LIRRDNLRQNGRKVLHLVCLPFSQKAQFHGSRPGSPVRPHSTITGRMRHEDQAYCLAVVAGLTMPVAAQAHAGPGHVTRAELRHDVKQVARKSAT
jgi:hypothetical protein